MFLIRTIFHMQEKFGRMGGIGSVFLLALLVGCGGPNPVTVASPTPTLPRISWTTFDLHLPPEALNAPVVGPLSNDTVLHVSITFHVNQQLLNTLQATPGQDLENYADQLGISGSEYQQIKQIWNTGCYSESQQVTYSANY